eukprot:Nitzschia sp. Nitz4//scaffold149_size55946//36205//37576//NITZ4_006599-RA/size55946-augustus-gene-0.66-mRNA-1//1//CDS//3329536824//1236//frame0
MKTSILLRSSNMLFLASTLSRTSAFVPAKVPPHWTQIPLRMAGTLSDATQPAAETKPSVPKTQRILSGIQPTGSLHLGNYLGAIRQWVDLQDKEHLDENGIPVPVENFFCVVDLHAITMPHDPKELHESTLSSAALYVAAGIDPAKSRIFVQSHVPAHAELAWLFNCITPMSWLERMIQFKEKSKKQGESVGVGLFAYPALMAADILLYQTNQVPVGEDQRQHLELTREVARRFHDMFCKGSQFKKRCKAAGIPSRPTFIDPAPLIMKEGARIMSLTDGTNKMSKSDPNDNSRINVLDSPDVIRNKIKRCKTDAFEGIEWDNPQRPEASNLLTIYAAVQPDRNKEEISKEVENMKWSEFKPALAEAIVNHLEPIQKRFHEVRNDQEQLDKILADGAEAASEVAQRTLFSTKVAMGFVQPSSNKK